MARTRRYRRRRFRPRRRRFRRRLPMYRLVRRALAVERKFLDIQVNDVAMEVIGNDVATQPLIQIAMGTDFNSRIGHQVRVTSISYNISIRRDTHSVHYRIGFLLPFNQNYDPAPAFMADFDHDETTVLRQKRGYIHTYIPHHNFKGFVRFKGRGMKCQFDDSSSTSIRKGHLWFFHHCTADGVTTNPPIMLGFFRIHFCDN